VDLNFSFEDLKFKLWSFKNGQKSNWHFDFPPLKLKKERPKSLPNWTCNMVFEKSPSVAMFLLIFA
jgi:hypothetical protein